MVTEPKPFQDFYKQITAGNLNRAFNCLFENQLEDNQLYMDHWPDATRRFLDIIHRRAYHSKEVCNRICDRLIELNVLTKQQVEKLERIDIPEPCHPGIMIPCVSKNGDGILIYAVSDKCDIPLNCDRYEILDPDLQFKKVVKNISTMLWNDSFLPDHREVVFYRLKTGFQNNYSVTCWDSAALSATLALVSGETVTNRASFDTDLPKDFPRVATGRFDGERFLKPESVIEKEQLIKDECPEFDIIAIGTGELPTIEKDNSRFKILADTLELVSEIAPIIRAHPPDADKLSDLQHKLVGIKKIETRWRYILTYDKLYDLCSLLLTRTEENEYTLPKFLLTCFDTARHVFDFVYALKFAKALEQHLNTDTKIFDDELSEFHAKIAILHTALYQHEQSLKYIKKLDLGPPGSSRHALYTMLFAECAFLAGDYCKAKSKLDSVQLFVNPSTSGRLEIYRFRLKMNQNINVTPEHPNTLNKDSYYKKSDKPYLYYVNARSLLMKGLFPDVLKIIEQAESDYPDPATSIWPGILWRRYGGLAAEALKNYTAAKELLTKPLPEKYADRFILNVHSAASHLLWWSMQLTTDGYEAVGSPKPIAEPLYHDLVRHHFEEDIETLVKLWSNRDPIKKIREQVEIIVRKSYE